MADVIIISEFTLHRNHSYYYYICLLCLLFDIW